MMKRFFSAASTSVVSAAVIVAVFSMLSRVFGFVRDRILSSLFGANIELDVYYAAFRMPDFIFQLIVIGALSACFIPVFNGYFGKDNAKAWRYTTNMVNALFVSFLVIAILGIVFAPWYTPLLNNFPADRQWEVINATRVLFLAQCFFAVSMVFGSVLQGAKRFTLYSVAPIVNNVGIIFGAIFLVPILGPIGLAWGAVFGAFMHAVVQTVGVYGLGYRYTLVFDLFDKDMLRTFRQMVPRVLGLAVGQVNFLIMTYFVSGLAVGSVTILQFAYNLNSFPIGVIGVSYAIAAFPTFCEYVKNDDKEKLRDSFSATVRQVIFFAIPATVMSLLLRAQIVRLVFGAGEFDWAATIATADTLAMFAISFFAQCLVYVVIRVYFAYHDTRTPLFIGIITTATNVLGGYLLTPHFGIPGLAFAFSLATMVQLALLWALLKTKLGSLQEWALLKSALILSIAGVTSVMTTQATKYVVGDQIQLNSFLNVLTQTCAAGGVGLFTYFAMAYLLRSPEMLSFAHGLQAKFMKTSKPAETIQQNAV